VLSCRSTPQPLVVVRTGDIDVAIRIESDSGAANLTQQEEPGQPAGPSHLNQVHLNRKARPIYHNLNALHD